MLKVPFLVFIMLFSVNTLNLENPKLNSKPFCRITCTINVPDAYGGTIGISGMAGNFLMSCEKARERACKKAARKAMQVLLDM